MNFMISERERRQQSWWRRRRRPWLQQWRCFRVNFQWKFQMDYRLELFIVREFVKIQTFSLSLSLSLSLLVLWHSYINSLSHWSLLRIFLSLSLSLSFSWTLWRLLWLFFWFFSSWILPLRKSSSVLLLLISLEEKMMIIRERMCLVSFKHSIL